MLTIAANSQEISALALFEVCLYVSSCCTLLQWLLILIAYLLVIAYHIAYVICASGQNMHRSPWTVFPTIHLRAFDNSSGARVGLRCNVRA